MCLELQQKAVAIFSLHDSREEFETILKWQQNLGHLINLRITLIKSIGESLRDSLVSRGYKRLRRNGKELSLYYIWSHTFA